MAEEESDSSLQTGQVAAIVSCVLVLVLILAATRFYCSKMSGPSSDALNREMKKDRRREADEEAARERTQEMSREFSIGSRNGRWRVEEVGGDPGADSPASRGSSRFTVWGAAARRADQRDYNATHPEDDAAPERSSGNDRIRRSRTYANGSRLSQIPAMELPEVRPPVRHISVGHMNSARSGLSDLAFECSAGRSFTRSQSRHSSLPSSDSRLRGMALGAADSEPPQYPSEVSTTISDRQRPRSARSGGSGFESPLDQQKRVIGELLSPQANNQRTNAWLQSDGPHRRDRRSRTTPGRISSTKVAPVQAGAAGPDDLAAEGSGHLSGSLSRSLSRNDRMGHSPRF